MAVAVLQWSLIALSECSNLLFHRCRSSPTQNRYCFYRNYSFDFTLLWAFNYHMNHCACCQRWASAGPQCYGCLSFSLVNNQERQIFGILAWILKPEYSHLAATTSNFGLISHELTLKKGALVEIAWAKGHHLCRHLINQLVMPFVG